MYQNRRLLLNHIKCVIQREEGGNAYLRVVSLSCPHQGMESRKINNKDSDLHAPCGCNSLKCKPF